jgi:RNA polymerase sigma-70 factor (ECF subfamily)
VNQRFQVIRGKQSAERGQESQGLSEPPTFEEALLAHMDSLLGFALRLTSGRRAEAEDLVQETSLRSFRNSGSLRSLKKIKSWLFKILVHTHINEFHRQAREVPIVDVELSETLLESASMEQVSTPEEHLFEQLLDGEIQEALDCLPVEFRIVVWLSDVEELSYREIAEIIGCPLGTVASRLYRGHGLLRERLREYGRQRGLIKE